MNCYIPFESVRWQRVYDGDITRIGPRAIGAIGTVLCPTIMSLLI